MTLREQAGFCAWLGSPLYSFLLNKAADDVHERGPAWEVLREFEHYAPTTALALRFMGSVHRLVLEGKAPALARHYPSVGGDGTDEPAWDAFLRTLIEHTGLLRELVRLPVQTNEVMRSAALVGGFLQVAAEMGLPLRLLEIGASAGLNLRWDHYRYEQAADSSWGDPDSPVRLAGMFTEGRPPFDVECEVVARRGCDLRPVDPTTEEGRLTLTSYVWSDQPERFQLLGGALEIAERVPADVEEAPAADWLAEELRELEQGAATVAFHSVVWDYLPPAEQEQLRGHLERAGRVATRDAPLAWLRMEPASGSMEVRLTMWPGGQERLLARTEAHGRPVRWL
jgi:hypothetical protein